MILQKLNSILQDADWDSPFFKILSKNDSGGAKGNQGGVAIPRDLKRFFPQIVLAGVAPQSPTSERILQCDMYDGMIWREQVLARYHVQTWGAARSPETRLTRLGAVWRNTKEGDLLIFQRHAIILNQFRIFRIETGTYETSVFKRWGAIEGFELPITEEELSIEAAALHAGLGTEEELFDHSEKNWGNRRVKVRRSAFRHSLLSAYGFKCCISGSNIHTPDEKYEVQAAHIIPVRCNGSNDLRNGMPLSATLHWAFDNGLICFNNSYEVKLSDSLSGQNINLLEPYRMTHVEFDTNANFLPSPRALMWHRENVFIP